MSKIQDKIVDFVDQVLPDLIDRTVRRLYFVQSDLHEVQERKELQRLENLLYALPQIEDCLTDWESELSQLEIGIKTKHVSSDIVMFAQNRLSDSEIIAGKVLSLQLKIERDRRKIDGLKTALEDWKIRGHRYYKILEYKYTMFMTDQEIAETMGYTVDTIKTRRLELLRLIYHRIEGAKGL